MLETSWKDLQVKNDGKIPPDKVTMVVECLMDMGINEKTMR
ncbi:hypothetical protein [Halobacillus litoralis]|nr:hypothetical protein [Halobacillus litoralis]